MSPSPTPPSSPSAPAEPSILLEARSAAFGYGTHPVVAGVDLAVGPGESLGIVGPNGSGKTTLFRGLLGLLEPMTGSVERRSDALGYVPQRETLDPVYPLTVEEVVRMGAYGRLRGWRGPSAEDRAECLHWLEAVELTHRREAPFASLSGGQRQRTLIARALLTRPRMLLLDEPTSGIDARAQALIFDLLARLREEEGLAILLVSHEIQRLRESVERVVWVDGGEVSIGDPRELLAPERLEQLFSRAAAAREN